MISDYRENQPLTLPGKLLIHAGLVLLLAISLGAAADDKNGVAKVKATGSDLDYSRVRFNVMVTSNVRPQGFKTQSELQRLVSDLRSWYANSFCGLEMEESKESLERLKSEADKKAKCGFVLQVAVTGISGVYDPEFQVSHAMLVKDGNKWVTLFDESPRNIPSWYLRGSDSHEMSTNPAESAFCKAAIVLTSVKIKSEDNTITISATAKNKLPFEVKNLRIHIPTSDAFSNRTRSFKVASDVVIPSGESKKITATGNYHNPDALEQHSKRAYITFSSEEQKDEEPAAKDPAATQPAKMPDNPPQPPTDRPFRRHHGPRV